MNSTDLQNKRPKFGVQTILWGQWITDFDSVFESIKNCGFTGVEIAQSPENLNACVGDIQCLHEKLLRFELDLIGLAGGTLQERLNYCRTSRIQPEYLYVEDWPPKDLNAIDSGYTYALHPHAYTKVQKYDEAIEILAATDSLKFLPDTAHLSIAGVDPVEIVSEWSDRIAAIHLKDWTPRFGISPYHYAKGFVPLGRGSLELKAFVQQIEDSGFDGWIIFELDHPGEKTAEQVCYDAAIWLAEHTTSFEQRTTERPTSRISFADSEDRFSQIFDFACLDPNNVHDSIAELMVDIFKCDLVNIWTCSPAHYQLTLSASRPRLTIRDKQLLGPNTLSWQSVAHNSPQVFDFSNSFLRNKFADQDLLHKNGFENSKMVSLPISNVWNPNHTWLVINLFFNEEHLIPNSDQLRILSAQIAKATCFAIDGRCSSAVREIHSIASKYSGDSGSFSKMMCESIGRELRCESVQLFTVNHRGDRLVHRAGTTPIKWINQKRPFYEMGIGRTGTVWKNKEPALYNAPHKENESKCSRDTIADDHKHEVLYAPVRRISDGEILGVLRCRGRFDSEFRNTSTAFSDDDITVVDAATTAAAPFIETFLVDEMRRKAMERLVHELGSPLNAVRNANRQFTNNSRVVNDIRQVFQHDYLGDIASWCKLMKRLLKKISMAGEFSSGIIDLMPEITDLAKDVIAPTARRVRDGIRNYDEIGPISMNPIDRGDWRYDIPKLFVDKNMFQEVVFNLLDNAVKHAFKDKRDLQIYINAEKTDKSYDLIFQDFGPGIDPELVSQVFEEGIRGNAAAENDVAGQGLGLWFVKTIVNAHDGTVEVTNPRFPTQITISLPKYLSKHPPNVKMRK